MDDNQSKAAAESRRAALPIVASVAASRQLQISQPGLPEGEDSMMRSDEWDQCPDGMLIKMVTEQRRQSRQRTVRRILRSSMIVLLILAGGVAVSTILVRGQVAAEELNCKQAKKLFVGYQHDRLNAETRDQLEQHFDRCPHCREKYEHHTQSEAAQSPPAAHEVAQSRAFPRAGV